MSFVVYHKETTIIPRLGRPFYTYEYYATESAAKGALTRGLKKGLIENRDDYAVSDLTNFFDNIEKKVVRKNLMSGKEFTIGVNTPCHLDPSTETYWSL